MVINIKNYRNKDIRDQFSHVFILNNPISVFIAKLIIDSFEIPENKIFLISFRSTNVDILPGKKIKNNLTFLDKLFRKVFLFSLQGIRLRRTLERTCNEFLLYCDWDNRDIIELINSNKYKGQAYIEEGQSAFNPFMEYSFKRNRFYQFERLKRWKRSSLLKDKLSLDIHKFNEFFNDKAFAFFTISEGSYPLIDKSKKVLLKDFSFVKNSYNPQLIGIKHIGIMCSPRRLQKDWSVNIKQLIDYLPDNSVIKLHPEFYSNKIMFEKFLDVFKNLKMNKNINLCSNDVLLEAEMLFEKKYLYGPLTSLIKYSNLLGSEFKKINIY